MSSTTDLPDESPTIRWNAWREYFAASRELTTALDRRLQDDAGISHPEFLVLLALWRTEEKQLRTGELAQVLNWEKSRVSHQVSRMAKRGFLERRECADDARGVWVAITAEGSRVLEAAGGDHGEAIRTWLLDLLTPEETDVIERVSLRIREKLIADGVAPAPRSDLKPAVRILEDTALPRATEADQAAAS